MLFPKLTYNLQGEGTFSSGTGTSQMTPFFWVTPTKAHLKVL